jgi:hypothetical protein
MGSGFFNGTKDEFDKYAQVSTLAVNRFTIQFLTSALETQPLELCTYDEGGGGECVGILHSQ